MEGPNSSAAIAMIRSLDCAALWAASLGMTGNWLICDCPTVSRGRKRILNSIRVGKTLSCLIRGRAEKGQLVAQRIAQITHEEILAVLGAEARRALIRAAGCNTGAV